MINFAVLFKIKVVFAANLSYVEQFFRRIGY